MLANVNIPKLSNDMNLAVQTNHLGVKFCTEVLELLKTASCVNILTSRFPGSKRSRPQRGFLVYTYLAIHTANWRL